MKSRTLTCVIAITVFAAPVAPTLVIAQDQPIHHKKRSHYFVKDLGSLGGVGGAGASAEAISNNGWVVGASNLAGDTTVHSFLWRDGEMTDLGTLGGLNSDERGLPISDNRGLIAGSAQTSAVDPLGENWGATAFGCNFNGPPGNPGGCDGYQNIVLGFVWQNGVMTALPTLGGNNALAFGINDHGQVVGEAENSVHNPECVPPQVLDFEAVIWSPEGESGEINIHQLPPLAGDTDGLAGEINDRGQVIGVSGPCSGSVTHAVLWDHNTVTDMGNLGGNCCNSPVDINSHGQVVGYSSTAGNNTAHAFLWQKGSTMADLGTLSGDFFSFAFGINDQGVIVGGSCSQIFNNCRAVLWQKDVMTDLNTLVKPGSTPLQLFFGNDINSRGEIATYAFNPTNGEFRAAVAIPCDENHDDRECEDEGEGTAVARGETNQRPNVVLPENVRKTASAATGPSVSHSQPRDTKELAAAKVCDMMHSAGEMSQQQRMRLCYRRRLPQRFVVQCQPVCGLRACAVQGL
jgi:probable HAF family extracellular repeat protein